VTVQRGNIILGIDPGTVVMGYAIIETNEHNIKILSMDVLKLGTVKDIYERLELIHTKVNLLITQYKPHTFAIEAPFFGKNVQSMLKLGRAQGVAIAAAMQGKINVTEYSPKKVKQSITGNGNAAKEQVWKMLQQTLQIEEKPQYFDATDALAVALCHHYQTSSPINKIAKGFKGWEDFVAKNEHRILKK
jgi:crossover junction endodeoxyribonuclease RuvC